MKVIIYTEDNNIFGNLSNKLEGIKVEKAGSINTLKSMIELYDRFILFADTKLIEKGREEFFKLVSKSDIDVVLTSSNPNFKEGFRYLKYNIKGYFNSYISKLHLEDVITSVNSGKVWFYPDFVRELIKVIPPKKSDDNNIDIEELLTDKELEVGKLISQGYSNKEIAKMLNITERTVKAHISSIYEKLPIKRDRVSLAIAIKENLN